MICIFLLNPQVKLILCIRLNTECLVCQQIRGGEGLHTRQVIDIMKLWAIEKAVVQAIGAIHGGISPLMSVPVAVAMTHIEMR